MKTIFYYFAISLFIITLFSCNNPLNKKYSDATFENDYKVIVTSKKADTADMVYLAFYIAGAKLRGENIEGKTYTELIKNAREVRLKRQNEEAEEKSLALKAAKEEAEKNEKFLKVLKVALYEKGFQEGDYENYLVYKIVFENKTNKDIKAVKGSIIINDLFDSKIKEIELVEDDGIGAGQSIRKNYTTSYNQFMDEDTQLRGKELDDLKVVWNPEKIIFTDGSVME